MKKFVTIFLLASLLCLPSINSAFAWDAFNNAKFTVSWTIARGFISYTYLEAVKTTYTNTLDINAKLYKGIAYSAVFGYIEKWSQYYALGISPNISWYMNYYTNNVLKKSLTRSNVSGSAPAQIIPSGASSYGGSTSTYITLYPTAKGIGYTQFGASGCTPVVRSVTVNF